MHAIDVMTSEVISVDENATVPAVARLLAELKAQRWAEVSPANVTVKDGVVHLWSSYLSEHEKRALLWRPRTSRAFGGSKTTCGGSVLPCWASPANYPGSLRHVIAPDQRQS